MQIESFYKNDIHIFRIKEDLHFNSDLSELKELIDENLEKGIVNIAVSLTPDSNLSSMSIGTLLQCNTMIKGNGGKLTIVQPNEADYELLEALSLNCLINTYKSEEAMFKD